MSGSPRCKQSVRKVLRSGSTEHTAREILDLRQSRFPRAGRAYRRLPAWRFAEARTENNIGPHPPRFARSPLRNSNEFQEGSCGPERHTGPRSRSLGRRHARRSARFGGSLDGIAATVMPALPVRQHRALGRRSRFSPLPLRFLRAHIQYPDEDTPREITQQGALADFRRHDDRAKEHPRERRGVRGERDDLVPVAQALPRMLLRSARKNSR